MKANRINMFIKLYQKEMMELKTEILLTVIAVIAAAVLVYVNGTQIRWTIVVFIMVAGLAGLLPVISAARIFNKEFNHNTIYLVMSLPIRGGMVLGAKLAAVVTQYLVGSLSVIVSAAILLYVMFPAETTKVLEQLNDIPWGLGVAFYFSTIVFGIYLVSIIFFSQTLSKLVSKFNGVVTFITLFALLWITDKVTTPLLNNIQINEIADLPPIGPIWYTSLIYLGVAAIIFVASVLIYNKRVEL